MSLGIAVTESSESCIDKGIATIAQYDNDSYADVYSFSIDETLINGNAPDIGVYESEYTASNDACGNGDVNGDDSLNVLDIVTLVNYIFGVHIPTDEEVCRSDINGDDILNILDVVALTNLILN